MGKNAIVIENWRHYCWSEVLEARETGCELYEELFAVLGEGTSFVYQ